MRPRGQNTGAHGSCKPLARGPIDPKAFLTGRVLVCLGEVGERSSLKGKTKWVPRDPNADAGGQTVGVPWLAPGPPAL